MAIAPGNALSPIAVTSLPRVRGSRRRGNDGFSPKLTGDSPALIHTGPVSLAMPRMVGPPLLIRLACMGWPLPQLGMGLT